MCGGHAITPWLDDGGAAVGFGSGLCRCLRCEEHAQRCCVNQGHLVEISWVGAANRITINIVCNFFTFNYFYISSKLSRWIAPSGGRCGGWHLLGTRVAFVVLTPTHDGWPVLHPVDGRCDGTSTWYCCA
jgi:hypothetical protein